MKILSFYQPVFVSTEVVGGASRLPIQMALNAGTRYVFNDEMANQIVTGRTGYGEWRCEKCGTINKSISTKCSQCSEIVPEMAPVPYEAMTDFWPFYIDVAKKQRPTNFRGKRVLFYRNRGIGDQLIASALSRFFSVELKAKCYQLVDRIHELLWWNNPFIYGQPIRFPLELDGLIRGPKGHPFYDWFIPLESISEFDSEREQSNVYDRMFALAGFDPERIPVEYKRPFWAMNQKDLEKTRDYYTEGPYVAFQVRSTNIGRTIPDHVLDLVLSRLNEIGMPILCMDELPLTPSVKKIVSSYKNARDISGQLKTSRAYGAVVSMAKLVVGPDSSAVHFAGVLDLPCIAFFSVLHPDSRVKYYKNCIPIFNTEKCPHAPCYNFMMELPYHKCPDGKEATYCKTFDSVTTDQIDGAIQKLGITK